jgi:hypothetical protein
LVLKAGEPLFAAAKEIKRENLVRVLEKKENSGLKCFSFCPFLGIRIHC